MGTDQTPMFRACALVITCQRSRIYYSAGPKIAKGAKMSYSALRSAGDLPAPAADNRITCLYTRVSTGYQVDKDSLPFQKKELENYCTHYLHIPTANLELFEDAGRSGKNTDRPAFQRMMQRVRSGSAARVVVYKIDRISRNLVDFSLMYDEFRAQRVTFVSLNEQFDTSSAIGEAVLKIILVFAELERKLTSERVSDVMIGRALNGQWNGARVPFGWDWDPEQKRPVHSPAESKACQLIYNMYVDTGSSVAVARYLNTHDIPTKRGGVWTTKTVGDVLHNPLNRGDYRYNYRNSARGKKKPTEEVVIKKGVYPALVDPALWDQANELLSNHYKNHNLHGQPHLSQYHHVFQRMLICNSCSNMLQARKADKIRANGFRPSMYSCATYNGKSICSAPYASDVVLGPFVFNYIRNMVTAASARIDSPEALEKVLLSGPEFENVAGIVSAGLMQTYNMLSCAPAALYRPDVPSDSKTSGGSGSAALQAIIDRDDRALERLKKVYLFDDAGMSEKEYLETRQKIETERVHTENKLKSLQSESIRNRPINSEQSDMMKAAAAFLLAHKIGSGQHIVYRDFAPAVGNDALRAFVRLVIENITIDNGRVFRIRWKNGVEHEFIYRS